MSFLQIAFVLVLVFVFPLADLWAVRPLRRYTSTPKRLRFYRIAVATSWLTAVVAALLAGRYWRALLFAPKPDWARLHTATGIILAALLLGYFGANFANGFFSLWRRGTRNALAKALTAMRFMLPVATSERVTWVIVSITAGICEEYLYRGYLMHVLQTTLHLPLLIAFVVAALAFGFGHLYQGKRGLIGTTIAGFAFGLLAILTGGLLVPMLLHVLVDLQILAMYQPQRDNPDMAAELMAGADPMAV